MSGGRGGRRTEKHREIQYDNISLVGMVVELIVVFSFNPELKSGTLAPG